jgi:hypothetical protein
MTRTTPGRRREARVATQIKPSGSGAYTTVTKTPSGCVAKSSTGLSTVAHQARGDALSYINEWLNAGGQGSHATLAAAKAAAVGILLQEV